MEDVAGKISTQRYLKLLTIRRAGEYKCISANFVQLIVDPNSKLNESNMESKFGFEEPALSM